MIAKTSKANIIFNDIIDIKPMNHWSTENLCLIGDAAHATTPNMGQGGCQAVEDAYILSKLLEIEKDWNKVFHQFEKIRKNKVYHIVNTSWTIGKIAQWENFTGVKEFYFQNDPESVNQKQMEKIMKLEI
jgi:2-polyprenyl-6-methoxyphenol hydroxylase-like FAD-dependent oxidoreductase